MAKENEARINRSVRTADGQVFGPGREDALMAVLPKEDVERLTKANYIQGDWSKAAGKRPPPRQRNAPQSSADLAATVAAAVASVMAAGNPNVVASPPAANSVELTPEQNPEQISLPNLPKHLAGINDTAVIGAMAALDTRGGAIPIYNKRIAEITGNTRQD